MVIAEAQDLAMVLKGKYVNTLGDTTLDQLACLSSVLSQAAAPQPPQPQTDPTYGLPTNQRNAPWVTTKVLTNGRIMAIATLSTWPSNEPIPAYEPVLMTPPPQTEPDKALVPTAPLPPPRVVQIPAAETASAPKVEPEQEEVPAPRVAPQQSARFSANASLPRHVPLGPAYNTSSQQAMLACAEISQHKLSPQTLAS